MPNRGPLTAAGRPLKSGSLIAPWQWVSSRSIDGQPASAERPPAETGLMAPSETFSIDAMVAACDGGDGALGHPKVYLNLAPSGTAECPYCSRRFVNRAVATPGTPALASGRPSGGSPPRA
jgi:uncharacterized Zn-finger protein